MPEETDPAIAVDRLMSRIAASAGSGSAVDTSFGYSSVEDLLVVAEARTAVRSRLPLPFRVKILEPVVLRLLAFASRDQRRVNLALIAALRASVAANRELEARVRALESQS